MVVDYGVPFEYTGLAQMKNLIVLLSLLLACPAFADAESCTPVKLPLSGMGAVRNQGIAGLCFAYAAADMVSWAVGWRISAVDIALYDFKNSSYPHIQDVYRNGGDEIAAINTGAVEGYCPESESPSDEPWIDFSEDPHAPIYDAFLDLDRTSWSSPKVRRSARKVFPNITDQDFDDTLAFRYPKRRILELQKRNCRRQRKSAPNFRMGMITSASGAGFVRLIDRELDKNLIVGIAFHSNSIYTIPDKEDGHVVSLVGRRWNSDRGVCEYLIRDTFGDQCDEYKPEFECHHGYLWVDDALLRRNVFEVDYIKRR